MSITSKMNPKLVLFVTLIASMSGLARADLKPDLKTYHQQVGPLLQKYCSQCHGVKTQKAKLRLDTIDPNIITGEHFGKWEDVREAFNTGEMPPEDKPQPTAAERDVMTRWLDAEFKKAKQHGNPIKRGSVRRLTRYELRYALEDLLKVSVKDEVNTLPEEGTSLDSGLKNSSRLLMISSPHVEAYLNVILSVINKMKDLAVIDPHSTSADIENLNVNPPVTFAQKGKKNRPPLAKVKRAGKGVVVDRGGYIDLRIPSIAKGKFQTILSAKADSRGRVQVSIGFQYSQFDPRQIVASLGEIEIEKSEETKIYSLASFPETLSDQMTRAIDRPFFIRVTNRTASNLYLEDFLYKGNVNAELTASLIPKGIQKSDIDSHVRQSISSFIEKAFRRAPTEAELKKYHSVYTRHAKGEKPVIALLNTYKEVLCSPGFFYLGLPGDLSNKQIANYKLAERLAFFLWCSVPDEQLLTAARTGTLTSPPVLASQVERMLKDEKSRRWVENFADQWLQTSKLFNVAVDRNYYPRFKDSLKELMRQETLESVNDVFRNGSPALNLLKADHVFVNQTLAGYYGIKGVRGDEFRKVAVDENSHRGGLLTQGTMLIGNSDGMNSHAILRGVWLTEVILKDPPPDPPANVPPFDESIPGFDKMTLNQKLSAHRDNAACRNCHQKIDPWGIPFENFDASGAWREKVLVISKAADQPNSKKKGKRRPRFEKSYVEIERESNLPEGKTLDGIGKLKDYLVNQRKRDFAKGLVERILAYGLSRDIDYYDEDLVKHLVDRFELNNYSVPALIRDIVQSESFRKGHTDGR